MQAQSIRQLGYKAEHIACDISDLTAQERAFEAHVHRCGGLDYAVLNAGIGEKGTGPILRRPGSQSVALYRSARMTESADELTSQPTSLPLYLSF